MKLSKQKLYETLNAIEKKYGSFKDIRVIATFVPITGLRIIVLPKESANSAMSDSLDLTDVIIKYRNKMSRTEAVAEEIEKWLKDKGIM